MSNVATISRRALKGLGLAAILLLGASGCQPGSVYVGVSGPGPWVGYPPGYYPPPGIYGRPWGYQPDEDAPEESESPAEAEPPAEAEAAGEAQTSEALPDD